MRRAQIQRQALARFPCRRRSVRSLLGSIDPAGLAALLGVVDVNLAHIGIGDHPRDERLGRRALDNGRVDHHAPGIIRAARAGVGACNGNQA